jgi:hypothetical protein
METAAVFQFKGIDFPANIDSPVGSQWDKQPG